MDAVVEGFLNLVLLPLQLLLVPIDMLLSNIAGIGAVGSYLRSAVSFVGSLPETLVSLTGVSPILWNAIILTIVAFLVISPTVAGIKKIVDWMT